MDVDAKGEGALRCGGKREEEEEEEEEGGSAEKDKE